jgi:hypothetical protein
MYIKECCQCGSWLAPGVEKVNCKDCRRFACKSCWNPHCDWHERHGYGEEEWIDFSEAEIEAFAPKTQPVLGRIREVVFSLLEKTSLR